MNCSKLSAKLSSVRFASFLEFAFAIFFFTACYKNGPDPEMSVYTNDIILGSRDEGSLDIISNAPWTIKTFDSWLSFSNNSGSGSATIYVFAKERNNSMKARTASFFIEGAGNTEIIQVTQNPFEYPEEIRLLASSDFDEKSWQWDTTVTGAVWGNMGYCGGKGYDVGTLGNGQWWGCTSEEDFLHQLQQTNDGIYHGDGNLNAKMTFRKDGTVIVRDKNGVTIRSDSYKVENYSSSQEGWNVGYLLTKAILWPYEINSGGNIPGKYEIVYLTENKMTLVYPDNGAFDELGNWGEATFWHFKAQ